MALQEIQIKISKYETLPVNIQEFTAEENLLMLLIGINADSTVKKMYINNDICKEIEQKIKNTYQKIIDDKDHQNKELAHLNDSLKSTFDETMTKTLKTYYDKIQDGVARETQNISALYEKQLLKNQERNDSLTRELSEIKLLTEQKTNDKINEIRTYHEKQVTLHTESKDIEIRKLTDELTRIKINIGKQINDEIVLNRKQTENEVISRLENKEIIIEKQKDELKLCQERVNSLEKTIIKLEDLCSFNEEDHKKQMELEINKLLTKREWEFNSCLEKYKKIIEDLKEKNTKQELQYKIDESQRIINLTEQNKQIHNDFLKAKTDFNNYCISIEKEKKEELATILQKNELLLQESIRTIEELKKEKNMSNTVRGSVGENYILELMKDTFYGFENFEIVNTSKISHSGDFIMNFKNFSILIDSKNYTNGVGKKEVKKLTDDINSNKHIKIAWMVSLNTPINGYSANPVMYDIKDNVCYCYINSLNKNENPHNFLKTIWFCCYFIFERILNVNTDEDLLDKYKKNETRIKNIVEKMLKKSKERFSTLCQLKDNFDETERDLKELLNDEIISIYDQHSKHVKNWWDTNIKTQENHKLKSKQIFHRFMCDDENKNTGISLDAFKCITKGFISDDNIVTTGKTDKGEYIYLNINFSF
jgi:hypothetical protein